MRGLRAVTERARKTGSSGTADVECFMGVAVADLWPRQNQRYQSKESKVHDGHFVYGC